jgi:hypothetical protein
MAEETEGLNRSAEKRSFKLGIDYEKNRLVVDLAGSLDWQDVSKLDPALTEMAKAQELIKRLAHPGKRVIR